MAQETDSNEHMNVQFYTTKYDIASAQFMAALGFDFQEQKARQKGFAYVEMNVKYLKEVLEDDPIHILTSVLACGNKVVTIKHEMIHSISKTVVSEAIAKWVVLDKIKRRAEALDEEVKQKIISMIAIE